MSLKGTSSSCRARGIRGLSILGIGIAVLSLFAACTTQETQGGNEAIKVLVSSDHTQFNPVWQRLKEFESETGLAVELDRVPTTDVQEKLLQDLRLGGCTYDNVEVLDGAQAAVQNQMADLEPFFREEGINVSDFRQGVVDWAWDASVFDGSLKYYPFYSGAKGIAYRKDLLEDPANQKSFQAEYGYALPLPPETPKQLLDLAKFFTREGMYGIVFSGAGDAAEGTVSDLIFRSGIEGYTDDNNDALWGPKHPENQAKVAAAARWLQDLVYKYEVAPREVTGMGTTEAVSFYSSGKAAMIYDHVYLGWPDITSSSAIKRIGKSGSFAPPSFEEGAGGIPFWWGRAIPDCSGNKAGGWEFMKWVMSEKNLRLSLTKGVGVYVPTLEDTLKWSVQRNVIPAGVAGAVTTATHYDIAPETAQIRQNVNIPLSEQLLLNELTPDEYASRSGDAIQQELEQGKG